MHENVEDPSKNTYDVLFDDSDTNEDVPLERMSLERVQPAYDRWAKPTLMQMGFHGDNLKREDGRITVEMVHRTAKPQSVYSHTPMKGLVQWPLVLSMRRNITGGTVHHAARLEPQTIESIQLLRSRKTPFVVALNKVDRLFGWKVQKNAPIRDSLAKQTADVVQEFEMRTSVVLKLPSALLPILLPRLLSKSL